MKVDSQVLVLHVADMMMVMLHADDCGHSSFLNGWFSCKSHMAEMTSFGMFC